MLTYDEPRELSVTHYSPLAGEDDRPRTTTRSLHPGREGRHNARLTHPGQRADEKEAHRFSANGSRC